MTKKECMDLILAKVAEDRRNEFISEMRNADSRKDRLAILEKYGIELSDEEKEALLSRKDHEVTDADLDQAEAGSVSVTCECHCHGPCCK